MTWFGNSLFNLKDQITTLTREVLAEVDEDAEQPRFVQIEKFNRLVKICEEKENQLCQLQLEIDRLRNFPQTSSDSQEASAATTTNTSVHVQQQNFQKSDVLFEPETKPVAEIIKTVDEESVLTQSNKQQFLSSSQNDENNSEEKQLYNVLQRIDSLNGKNRLAQLQVILKEVKLAYESEKTKIKPSTSVISFLSSKNSHGTDETMSNDSERSDDSLLNDFEVLKPRSTSTKSLEELSLSNAETQTSTYLTRSTFTQSEFEFSAPSKNVSSAEDTSKTTDQKSITDFDEVERALETNVHCWQEVLTKMNPLKKCENVKSCENDSSSEEAFWTELNELIFKNNEALKRYIDTLVQENRSWKQFYHLLNQNEDCTKKRIEKLIDREFSLTESIKQKNFIVVKYANQLNSYSKDLENFNFCLSKISNEILDKTVELNSIYEEVKTLNETKDRLRKENEELCEIIEKIRECKADDLTEKQIEHESKFALLKQQYEVLERECNEQQQTLNTLENELRESRDSTHLLNEQLQKMKNQFSDERQQHEKELSNMEEKLSNVEIEKHNYVYKVENDLLLKNETIVELQDRGQRLENEIESWKSKFCDQVDSSTRTINDLNEQKLEIKQNITKIVHSCVENEDKSSKLEKIIALLKNYFASSDEEKEMWHRITEFVVKFDPSNEESAEKSDRAVNISEEMKFKFELYEIENKNLHETVKSLECDLSHQRDFCDQLKNNVVELESKLSNVVSEREQVITSLKEKHAESLKYHNELQRVHAVFITEQEKNEEYIQQIQNLKQKLDNNNNMSAELERLRSHLLNMEESHTNELLNTEEQIKELKNQLMDYEGHIKSINAAQTSVNVRTNQITESLQKEIKILTEEKEKLSSNLKSCQIELQKNIQDAQNLRSALDLFYRNKDSEIFQATEKLQTDVKILQNENRVLEESVRLLQSNLDKLKEKSNEKDAMCNEIKHKDKIIERLEVQVKDIQVKLTDAETKIEELKTDTENEFKLNLLKNIVLRYVISNTESMKTQALQILADVLDFTIDEKRKVGLGVSDDNKNSNASALSKDSLIDEFIKFVENESDPKKTISQEKKPNCPNILLSPSSSLPDIMLPTLSQFPVNHNSRYILKDVLQ